MPTRRGSRPLPPLYLMILSAVLAVGFFVYMPMLELLAASKE